MLKAVNNVICTFKQENRLAICFEFCYDKDMRNLRLNSNSKSVRDYYTTLERYEQSHIVHEGAVSTPLGTLLQTCARQVDAVFVPQYAMRTERGNRIVLDGAILDEYELPFAYCEAKDMADDLEREITRKIDAGYPTSNIFFYTPQRGVLYQNDKRVLDVDMTQPDSLLEAVQRLFSEPFAAIEKWHAAVAAFKERVPALGRELAQLIRQQHQTNTRFTSAFADFYRQCRASINPNLSKAAVEEMLIQHLLTERIFRTVFDNPDFTHRNIIARDIEKVIYALTHHAFSRDGFMRRLEPFYRAIEQAATLCTDFSQKQHFLNTVYEQFFQGFSTEVADTHGIVYTPQPIVDFMVKSVEYLLETEFNRSLSEPGVHIIDPFVGTGNFIVRLMQDIEGTMLEEKYGGELHCNELMLLPYYISSLNIEHEYFRRTGEYLPFEGICLVDTFELLESEQAQLFTRENTARVERQKASEMFVVLGNPPYNAGQVNENDNNKNRQYPAMDKRIEETYVSDSMAQNKNKLYDPYVKAFRWASDRIGEQGIVAFVTNHSFLDGISFDGMRKHLAADFDSLYLVDLGGNVRKGHPGNSNVFGIQVGVSINILVKTKQKRPERPRLLYNGESVEWDQKRTFGFLNLHADVGGMSWEEITPNAKQVWLTSGLREDFETLIPIGIQKAKARKEAAAGVIFHQFSNGVITSRDAWTINFNAQALSQNMQRMIENYNTQVFKWQHQRARGTNVDDFVDADATRIKWSSTLKRHLNSGHFAEFEDSKLRRCLYRPFTKRALYFDRMLIHRPGLFPFIFPTPDTEKENQTICINASGTNKFFHVLMANIIPDLHLTGDSQCFPFYIYSEDGSNRRENITEWALAAFRTHYGEDTISKWDIFHYIYALLHQPDYRETYQMNLKRDLPHIPFAPDFWAFVNIGARLAELHVNYETQPESAGLQFIETPDVQRDWRVEKMRFSKEKTQLHYNDFLTIAGIPAEVFAYRLGARSALEWVVDGYRVKVDKRSGIVNDPNRADVPKYIVELIGRVVSVSLETVKLVGQLPPLAS